MTLKDVSNGPEWTIWMAFILFLILSIVLLSGRGGWLIAGYNTASKKEKEKYNEKKLCRVAGGGMLVIALLILVMGLWEDVLPMSFAYVFLVVTIVDCVAMIILMNTICKK